MTKSLLGALGIKSIRWLRQHDGFSLLLEGSSKPLFPAVESRCKLISQKTRANIILIALRDPGIRGTVLVDFGLNRDVKTLTNQIKP